MTFKEHQFLFICPHFIIKTRAPSVLPRRAFHFWNSIPFYDDATTIYLNLVKECLDFIENGCKTGKRCSDFCQRNCWNRRSNIGYSTNALNFIFIERTYINLIITALNLRLMKSSDISYISKMHTMLPNAKGTLSFHSCIHC